MLLHGMDNERMHEDTLKTYTIYFKRKWWGYRRAPIRIMAFRVEFHEKIGILKLALSKDGLLSGSFTNVLDYSLAINQ